MLNKETQLQIKKNKDKEKGFERQHKTEPPPPKKKTRIDEKNFKI